MENRDRDKMNKDIDSTDAGDVNGGSTPERKGRIESDSDADFGGNIGRSENWDSEPSRRGGNIESDDSSSNVDVESDRGRGRSLEH